MNLDLIEKHIHLTELPSGAEVSFGGQPCLTVENYGETYLWKINPFFAKMSYGANVFMDIPYCVESRDSLEEAIAAGLTTLYDLGAFSGVVDIPEDSYVEAHLDESVYDSVLADCRAEAVNHCDNLMEVHRFANDLYGSFISELSDAKYSYVAKNAALRAADGYGKLSKEKAGTKQSDAIVKDIIHDEDSSFAAKKKLEKRKAEKKNKSVDEAIKDSDAYWKDFDARQKEAAAKKERARAGIAEPVKKGQGRPTSIDREDLKDRAKENIKNGKRPSHGFDRNEKLTYVRHLLNHPDHPEFAEAHVAKAGRTVGTTKAAKAEKEKSAEQEKATTRATAGWMAGLGAR